MARVSKIFEELPKIFSEQLEELYGRLSREAREVWVPEKQRLGKAILEASFKAFESVDEYTARGRAHQYSWRISNRLGRDFFRVYFNDFSRKVYVDLNAPLTAPLLEKTDGFLELATEIVRSIMFTDPNLLDEEAPTEVVIV